MKTIELIDKYIVKQSDDTGYDPPSYIWSDNTGEIVRCRDCKHWALGKTTKNYPNPYICDLHSFMHGFERSALPEDYCSWGERKMAELTVPINVNLPDDWKEQILERIKQDNDWVYVVRCRDCVHVGHDIWDRGAYCKYHKIDINDDDYCSYGARKEEE